MLQKCYKKSPEAERAGGHARSRAQARAPIYARGRSWELGAGYTRVCELEAAKEEKNMKYRVTFKGWDCEENYVEISWEYATRGEADRKYVEMCDFAEWGDNVLFEEIRG